MNVVVEIREGNDIVGVLLPKPRVFSTGSRGLFGVTKVEIGGKKFQVQLQAVEIGSKQQPVKQQENSEGAGDPV